MKKKVTPRICEICGTTKRTTNTQTPYIGRECYRTDGRELLLQTTLSGTGFKKGLVIVVVVAIIAFLIGKFI